MITKLIKNFFYCGVTGWFTEILFTAFQSFRRRDWRLIGQTSVWMFPIYGMGCLLLFPYRLLKNHSTLVRGVSYTLAIFTGEYLSGRLLTRFHACPWDYSSSRFNLHRVIRLDYAPGWFLLGLFLERFHRQE
ncbi:MAG: hypothetical protein IJP31_04300 [Lachnospiraceae bacterium]|nr:hypothetical protein [Lachnospiraceae bacterium]